MRATCLRIVILFTHFSIKHILQHQRQQLPRLMLFRKIQKVYLLLHTLVCLYNRRCDETRTLNSVDAMVSYKLVYNLFYVSHCFSY